MVCVWSPYRLEDIIKIQSVQRRFTKRIGGLSDHSDVSYKDRLETLSLESLELRVWVICIWCVCVQCLWA